MQATNPGHYYLSPIAVWSQAGHNAAITYDPRFVA